MLITFTLMQIIRVIYGRHLARPILILAAICGNAVNRCYNFGGIFFRISELEVPGPNFYERKQDFQQEPPSPKNKNKCLRVNKLHPVVLQSRHIN